MGKWVNGEKEVDSRKEEGFKFYLQLLSKGN